jgi:hypothetical protein
MWEYILIWWLVVPTLDCDNAKSESGGYVKPLFHDTGLCYEWIRYETRDTSKFEQEFGYYILESYPDVKWVTLDSIWINK